MEYVKWNWSIKFKKWKRTLVSGIDSIGEGVSALSKGTNELNSKTSNLPDEVDDKIDEMVSKYSNSDLISIFCKWRNY